MRREFRVISICEKQSRYRINDSEVHVRVEMRTIWEMGELAAKYNDIVEILDLMYPIRDGQHYFTLLCYKDTDTCFSIGYIGLQRLWSVLKETIEEGALK